MIRMPNLTEDFKALESGTFFVDDNICLLGNVAGFFTDINNNIYTNKRGKLFFEGLVYRLQSGKNTVIIAESDVIQEYRNLFNYMFETTQYSNNRYNFPQKYPEAITFVDVGLGSDCWENNKTNIFSRYINYTRDNHMKFDHIIANPPYEFGNAITTTVLNNVDFDDYVNLMPVSKYKKGKIYQHIVPNSLKPVKWEGDAFTNPQIAIMKKERDQKIAEEDFNTWCYDKRFFKFYVENQKRKHYAIDTDNYISTLKITPSYDTTFFITTRTPQNGIHKTPSCHDYRWNILKTEPLADILDEYNRPRGTFVYFNTKAEKDNFSSWWYNSKIWSQVIWGTYKQSGSPNIFLPKLDWSKEWTDEEILKDYGYSDEEIRELLK